MMDPKTRIDWPKTAAAGSTARWAILLLLVLQTDVQAQFSYTTGNGTITITGYTGPGGAVTIPNTINDLPVVAIGDSAFSDFATLTSIAISEGVRKIGAFAFSGCSSLTEVDIPKSVDTIGDGAFYGWTCPSLVAIDVDPLNLVYSSESGVLFDKSHTLLIEYPPGKTEGYAIPAGVTTVGPGAFLSCSGLTSVVITDSVTNLGGGAFQWCTSLASVRLGTNISSMGAGVFEHCLSLGTVTIPDGVIDIAGNAFYGCVSLVSVRLGKGVKSIADSAFLNCPDLVSVEMSQGLTNIGVAVLAGVGGFLLWLARSRKRLKAKPMKESLFFSALLLGCGRASLLGQGVVNFSNRAVGTVITHVYLPSPATPGLVQIGNGASDFPVGTTDWTGWTPVSGAGFSAQLFASPGADVPVDSLAPGFPITTFRTGAAAGFINPVYATLSGVPIVTDVATIQMRVWDNKGGVIQDWVTATAQAPGTERMGMSAPINVNNIANENLAPFLIGLQSFNLTYNVSEPSAFTLAGLGAFLLWLARPRKRVNGDALAKSLIFSALLLGCGCASVLGQGMVVFNNREATVVVSHVYLPSPTTPGLLQVGNGSSDFPPGTTDWTGWTPVTGDGFSAQLFAAEGTDVPADSLAPAFPTTTFRTGVVAGFVNGVIVKLAGVRIGFDATIQMRVWDNNGGAITDWATAVAQPPKTEILGMSAPINVPNIAGGFATPSLLVGLQSFNLTYNVPEPSAFALAGAGGSLLWLAKPNRKLLAARP